MRLSAGVSRIVQVLRWISIAFGILSAVAIALRVLGQFNAGESIHGLLDGSVECFVLVAIGGSVLSYLTDGFNTPPGKRRDGPIAIGGALMLLAFSPGGDFEGWLPTSIGMFLLGAVLVVLGYRGKADDIEHDASETDADRH